jgi:hypothetical protein
LYLGIIILAVKSTIGPEGPVHFLCQKSLSLQAF